MIDARLGRRAESGSTCTRCRIIASQGATMQGVAMAAALSAADRLSAVDWIVDQRTGLYGDHRDALPERPVRGDESMALVANACDLRQQLLALGDHELLLELRDEIARFEERQQGDRIALELALKQEQNDRDERNRLRQAELGRRGGSHDKRSPVILAACQQIRQSLGSSISAKRAWDKLCKMATAGHFVTADDSFGLCVTNTDRVGVVSKTTGKVVRAINERTFRKYWADTKAG
jgi:hypothetical protein